MIIYRCFIRKKLIERGIVEWLVRYLEQLNPNWSEMNTNNDRPNENDDRYRNKSQASCYGLEYSTALFMNLCLHKSGKEKCLPMAKLVLQIFAHLLNSQVKQVKNDWWYEITLFMIKNISKFHWNIGKAKYPFLF